MTAATRCLRVTSIRSQSPRGFGGSIFTGKEIGPAGEALDAASYYVVKASASVLAGLRVELGQWLQAVGSPSRRVLEVNGYQVTENQIDASSVLLMRPSGEHVVAFLADNKSFERIGQVKARRLWERFGERLYEILDEGNAAELTSVLPPESAAQVVAAWAQFGDSRTLRWLQDRKLDLKIGRKVLEFFGPETPQKLEEDPYRLLSFCATWRQADDLARGTFGVAPDDPRRLQGVVEEACYRAFADGHTSVLSSSLMDRVQRVLGAQTQTLRWRHLVDAALTRGLSNGSYVVGHHGVQPLGALVMERQVAKAIADRVAGLPAPLLSNHQIAAHLRAYEAVEGIELNAMQRRAVELAAVNRVTVITGGAGVGKTTVLKALYGVYDAAGVAVTQLALAGRAAKRMLEATGRPATTIASFLRSWTRDDTDERRVLVVDEASMVDIITMSRLCEQMGPSPRLVLVGDPSQLLPVGPGLVLHALIKVRAVPVAELTVVKRYGGAIAEAATAIRAGKWPALPADPEAEIALVPRAVTASEADGNALAAEVVHLYRQDPSNTQILCARRSGPDGATLLNAMCQMALTSRAKPVRVWDYQHEAYALVGLNLGDPVLCTRNLWDRGLQNGSLGVVVEVEDEPKGVDRDDEEPPGPPVLAWIEWDDGVRRPLLEDMLDDVELGYAITVHKAQGSQWPRVIVPVTTHRMLDRTLLYTAVTRAQRQVLLVGDEAAASAATQAPPRDQLRSVALDLTLREMLAQPVSV